MRLTPNFAPRQRQSLSITTQSIQSLNILQFGQQELHDYLREQAERNPLIELSESARPDSLADPDQDRHDIDLDPAAPREPTVPPMGAASSWQPGATKIVRTQVRAGNTRSTDALFTGLDELESVCAAPPSLHDHLGAQVTAMLRDGADIRIALEIVGSIDPDGYLRRELDEIADTLDVAPHRIAAMLEVVQQCDPTGVGARDLAECLALQLQEGNRLTRAMRHLLENLPLLAQYRYARLARICGVDLATLSAMAHELRALDPRPGRRFDTEQIPPAVPDLSVVQLEDGRFAVELNRDFLPRVIVNRRYYAQVREMDLSQHDRRFVVDCIQSASYLERNLDQRAQTILKVATEIVARQGAFLRRGVEHLRPLTLRDVAKAIGVHESTVSRAIANKYMMTQWGMFELKLFFAGSISGVDGATDVAAEKVRHLIRQLIEHESPGAVLSDDAIVTALLDSGIKIARRTVAKYRELMAIPSSACRRREKSTRGWRMAKSPT
ncbi:MAG: RNA polymerase factor sigma-54 [Burkholderiaceae bacterium]